MAWHPAVITHGVTSVTPIQVSSGGPNLAPAIGCSTTESWPHQHARKYTSTSPKPVGSLHIHAPLRPDRSPLSTFPPLSCTARAHWRPQGRGVALRLHPLSLRSLPALQCSEARANLARLPTDVVFALVLYVVSLVVTLLRWYVLGRQRCVICSPSLGLV